MRVPVVVKVGLVAISVMGAYSGYANYIPQIESKPPQELSLEGGTVTPAQLVKAGEEIFKTKGTCEICHRIGQKGTRAPDLAGIGARAAKTKPGMSAKAYILESLLQPAAYIVEGYPPIMPAVDKPPIALNRSEVWALTAFLESLGGNVDVTLNDVPATVGAGSGGAGAVAELKIPGDPKAGEAVFQGKGTCIACHKAGPARASPAARRARDRDPPARRLLRLHAGRGEAAGAARAARRAPGAAGLDPVPRQGVQHLGRGESAAQGCREVPRARGERRRDLHPQLRL